MVMKHGWRMDSTLVHDTLRFDPPDRRLSMRAMNGYCNTASLALFCVCDL